MSVALPSLKDLSAYVPKEMGVLFLPPYPPQSPPAPDGATPPRPASVAIRAFHLLTALCADLPHVPYARIDVTFMLATMQSCMSAFS